LKSKLKDVIIGIPIYFNNIQGKFPCGHRDNAKP